MAQNIKGVSLSIGMDTSGFKSGLTEIQSKIKIVEDNVKAFKKALQRNPNDERALDGFNKSLAQLKDWCNEAKKGLDALWKEMEDNGIDITEERMVALNEQLSVLFSKIDKTIPKYDNFVETLGQTKEAVDDNTESFSVFGDVLKANAVWDIAKGGLNLLIDGLKMVLNLEKEIAQQYVEIIKGGIEYNAEIEKYSALMTALTGSSQMAENIMNELTGIAIGSGYGVDVLAKGVQQLVSAGVESGKAVKTVEAFSKALASSGGGNEELSRIITNLAQIQNIGKASEVDMKQFGTNGINAWGLLSEYTGKSVADLKDGKVTFDLLSQAFIKAGEEGGKYGDAFEIRMQTFLGQIDQLKTQWNILSGLLAEDVFMDLKNSILPNVNEILSQIIEAFKNGGPQQAVAVFKGSLPTLIQGIMETLPQWIDAGIEILTAVIDALNDPEVQKSLNELLGKITELIILYVDNITPILTHIGTTIANAVGGGFIRRMQGVVEEANLGQAFINGNSAYNYGRTYGQNPRSSDLGIYSGGIGAINLSTTIQVNNNGQPIDESAIRSWGSTITDVVTKELARRM